MNTSKPPNSTKSKNANEQKSKFLKTLKKKKECESKALEIVIELIDGGLNKDVLLNKLGSINACHYDDVVEERFILSQCGYVMCNELLTCIPKQHYKIIHNKVYDITERKKFCSNFCYKSSNYLRNQLLTSPLWLRDTEVVPKFQLLKTASQSSENGISSNELKTHGSQLNDKENKCDDQLQEKTLELKIRE